MRTLIAGVELRVAGRPLACETTVEAAGPYVLVLTTSLPDEPLIVMTTYVGADDVDTVAVELLLGERRVAHNQPRRLPRDAVPVTHARDRCVLDHLAQVQSALAERRHEPVSVDVPDAALTAAEQA